MRFAGLGTPAAAWRPTRGWDAGPRLRVHTSDLKNVVESAKQRAAAKLFTPAFAVSSCGQPGGLPCTASTPQSALAGLGAPWDYDVTCSEFSAQMDRMSRLLGEVTRLGLTGTVVEQAKQRFADESSAFFWKRSDPVLPSTCTRVTGEVTAINEALSKAIAAAGGNTDVAPPPIPGGGNETASTIKTVAIAAGVIAGVVVLAPLVFEGVAWAKIARKARGR